MTYFFWQSLAIMVVIAAVFATVVAWARRDTWARPISTILFVVALAGSAIAVGESLGHHRPMTWQAFRNAYNGELRALVLGHKIVFGKAVYVYVDEPGVLEPLAVVLPWDQDVAQRLQDLAKAQRDGRIKGFELILPYEKSLSVDPSILMELPQPKFLPDKPLQQIEPPTRYERT